MSEVHSEIYKLIIYMQEMKSSFKTITSQNTVAILFLHFYSSI